MQAWAPPRAQQAQISRLPYTPGLDGLRALAVLAVIVYHANHAWLPGGFLGVEVFFVISGYLITLLLIGEHERKGRISLKRFWLRRARRLLPALLVLLVGAAVYLAFFNREPQGQARGDFVGAITYGSNWYQIAVGQGYTASAAFAPLRHLWSLAVEEQFYLLWPLVMAVVLRGRTGAQRLPKIGLWLFAASAAIAVAVAALFVPGDVATSCSPGAMHGFWRIGSRCINVNEALYLGTLSRAGGLLLGAALAMWWRPVAILRGPLRDKPRRLDLLALVGVVGLGVLTWKLYLSEDGTSLGLQYDPLLFRGGFFLTGVATLFVIAAVTHRRSWTGKVLGMPLLRWIGQRSYGLYLFHWLVFQVIRKEAGIDLTGPQFAVGVAVTFVIAELSYRLVELPVRSGRLGEWLRGQRVARTRRMYNRRRWMVAFAAIAAGLAGFAGVSIATADNVCVGALECSLRSAGGTAPPPASIAPAPTTTAPAASTTAAAPPTTVAVPLDLVRAVPPPELDPLSTAAGTTTTTGAEASSTTAAPDTTPVTAATDVTGTSVATRQAGPAPLAIGESVMQGATNQLAAGGFNVDAQQSRQGLDIAALVEAHRAAGDIGSIVVIQAGTNGSVSDATYDRMMASLPADQTPYVFFLTVRAPRGWIDANNARIQALPSRYPNVHVIDWNALSAANDVSFCKDGFHIACSGSSQQTYANLIFEAIGRPDLEK